MFCAKHRTATRRENTPRPSVTVPSLGVTKSPLRLLVGHGNNTGHFINTYRGSMTTRVNVASWTRVWWYWSLPVITGTRSQSSAQTAIGMPSPYVSYSTVFSPLQFYKLRCLSRTYWHSGTLHGTNELRSCSRKYSNARKKTIALLGCHIHQRFV